jgi:membrane protease YdiL (CAAX protease family)
VPAPLSAAAKTTPAFAGDAIAAASFCLSKRFSLLAAVAAYLLVEGGLWTAGAAQRGFIIAAMGWIVACTLLQRRSLEELGLGLRGFRQSSWLVLVAAVLAAIMLAMHSPLGIAYRPIHLWQAWGYPLWALEQEFILNSFLFLNLERLTGPRLAIVLSALAFAVAHIPNPLLTALTLLAGLVFCAVFARYRNIWALAIAHALLGMTIAGSAPVSFTHRMRVGRGYYAPTPITLSVPSPALPRGLGSGSGVP